VKISFIELTCKSSVRLSSSFDVRSVSTVLSTFNKGFLHWSTSSQKEEIIHKVVLRGFADVHVRTILLRLKIEHLVQ
jgi:hypothetical protein